MRLRMIFVLVLLHTTMVSMKAALAEEGSNIEEDSEELEEDKCVECTVETKNIADIPFNFSATETFITEYVGDNGNSNELTYGDDDDFWVFRNLLHLRADNRYFSAGLLTDVNVFHQPPSRVSAADLALYPGGSGYTTLNYGNDIRVERIYGTARIGGLSITGGDFYVSFGRGMVLSLIKQGDAGIDNSLRGGRIEYYLRDSLRLTLIGGVVNSLNLDPVTHQVWLDDPNDRILGARIQWSPLDPLTLFAHGVYMKPRFEDEAAIDPERNFVDQGVGVGLVSGGGGQELYVGDLHLYLEGNAQSHDNYRPPGEDRDVIGETGYAVFGEISYDATPVLLKAEGIFYRHWLMEGPYRGSSTSISALGPPVPYHHLVTLEPKWMTINSLGNAEGGRLTADFFSRATDTSISLMTSAIVYEQGVTIGGTWDDVHPRTFIVHPILRARQSFKSTGVDLALEGGYRYESALEDISGHEGEGSLWHVSGDITVPISGPHSLELKSEVRRHELHVNEFNEHWITLTSLMYSIAGTFDVSLLHEYSDETLGSDVAFFGHRLPLPKNNYASAVIGFHAPRPLDSLSLKLMGGAQRGGIKCVGGVCREYPESVGARLEVVYRF